MGDGAALKILFQRKDESVKDLEQEVSVDVRSSELKHCFTYSLPSLGLLSFRTFAKKLSSIPVDLGSVLAECSACPFPQVSVYCCNCWSGYSLPQAYPLSYSQKLFSNPPLKEALVSHPLGSSQVIWSDLLFFFHINYIHIYYGCKYYAHLYADVYNITHVHIFANISVIKMELASERNRFPW